MAWISPTNKQVSYNQWQHLSTPPARLHQTLPAAICCSESLGLLISGAHLSPTVKEQSRVLEGHKDAFEIAKEKKNSFVRSSCHCFICHPPQHQFLLCQLEGCRWQMGLLSLSTETQQFNSLEL